MKKEIKAKLLKNIGTINSFLDNNGKNRFSSAVGDINVAVANKIQNIDPKWLAECFHEYYENYAEIKGWKTNKKCRVAFKDLPEKNRATMICTASTVLMEIAGKIAEK